MHNQSILYKSQYMLYNGFEMYLLNAVYYLNVLSFYNFILVTSYTMCVLIVF